MVSFGQKLKMPKTCKKAIYKRLRVVLCKKPLEKIPTIQKMRQEKTPNIRKMRRFWKLALSPWKGYSRCKMISLGQNIKKPLYKKTRVVLCKKPRAKTPNIREKRLFWKSGLSVCKGHSLCKIVSLGQKLKIPKTCKKEFYKNITVALCKKQLEKTPNNRKLRQFSKSAILQRQ